MNKISDRESARRRSSSAAVRGIIPVKDRRAELDFYCTPPVATLGLLSVEKLPGSCVWDPSCGDGAISKVLKARGYSVVATDLADRGYGRGGVDFLKTKVLRGDCSSIVTNPPFTHMVKFVEHATSLKPLKFCFIGRVLFLEGRKKRDLFERAGLSRVWIFDRRINITPDRYENKNKDGLGGMIAYAWYIFEPRRQVPRPVELGYIDITACLESAR